MRALQRDWHLLHCPVSCPVRTYSIVLLFFVNTPRLSRDAFHCLPHSSTITVHPGTGAVHVWSSCCVGICLSLGIDHFNYVRMAQARSQIRGASMHPRRTLVGVKHNDVSLPCDHCVSFINDKFCHSACLDMQAFVFASPTDIFLPCHGSRHKSHPPSVSPTALVFACP